MADKLPSQKSGRGADAGTDTLSGDSTGSVRAISRALLILRTLAHGGVHGMRISDVIQHSGLTRPTTHRLLQTLIGEGVAEQDALTRRYRLGNELGLLGMSRPPEVPVRAAAEPHLEALANDLGDTAFLTIRSGLDSVGLDRRTGSYPIKVLAIDVGARRPLGVGVAGVMLLASLTPEEADRICERNISRLPADGPSMSTIAARVRAARNKGYAYSEVGVLRGTRAAAVPVMNPQGEVIAALSVAAMANRLREADLPGVIEKMRDKTALITQRLAQMERPRTPDTSRKR